MPDCAGAPPPAIEHPHCSSPLVILSGKGSIHDCIARNTMQDTPQHRWDVMPEEAIEIQQQLRSRVQLTNGFDPAQVHNIGGIDASYRDMARAAVVVLSFPELQVVDSAIAVRETPFPY